MRIRTPRDSCCWRVWLALAFVLLLALPAAAQPATIALVSDLEGKATLTAAGHSAPAQILSDIAAGAQVQLASGARLVILYLDGGAEFTFKGPSQIEFKPDKPEVINGAPPAVRVPAQGSGVRLKPAGLGQGALVLRSPLGSSRIKILSANGTRLLETQPEFRWLEPEPGLRYHVEITDDSGRSLYDGQVGTSSFVLPAGLQLKDGMSYMWEVSSRLPDGRKYSSVGVFSVATAELRAQAASMLARPTPDVSSRVALSVWLEQMELRDEARKQWLLLLQERPEESRIRALADK
jgi:hypothetical protein